MPVHAHVRLEFVLAVGSFFDEAILRYPSKLVSHAAQDHCSSKLTCAPMVASCSLNSVMTVSATTPSTNSVTLQSVLRWRFLTTLRVRGTAGTLTAGAAAGFAAAASTAGGAGWARGEKMAGEGDYSSAKQIKQSRHIARITVKVYAYAGI